MRYLTIALLTLGFTSTALAQSALESCTEVPELAADVMRNRQVNYDIMLMLNRISGELTDHVELLSWAQAMIDMAYAQPSATTPEARAQQVEDFAALWQERCISKMPQ
tara:strand:+ start:1005 stop:1328 length:324 start_codon:yes stop_codon:yes gene_type:complete